MNKRYNVDVKKEVVCMSFEVRERKQEIVKKICSVKADQKCKKCMS